MGAGIRMLWIGVFYGGTFDTAALMLTLFNEVILNDRLQGQKSARFARQFFPYWAVSTEGRRWYPRKQWHSLRYRIGG